MISFSETALVLTVLASGVPLVGEIIKRGKVSKKTPEDQFVEGQAAAGERTVVDQIWPFIFRGRHDKAQNAIDDTAGSSTGAAVKRQKAKEVEEVDEARRPATMIRQEDSRLQGETLPRLDEAKRLEKLRAEKAYWAGREVHDAVGKVASAHSPLRIFGILVVALLVAGVIFLLTMRFAPRTAQPPQNGLLISDEALWQVIFLVLMGLALLLFWRRLSALFQRSQPSAQLLLVFGGIFACYGGTAIIHYRYLISVSADKLFLGIGLAFTMLAGMFVQVITSNYKAGASLLAITRSQLIYPALFSPIVFYAIWAAASVSSPSVFSFYAAFLNGYFWQSVVASAQQTVPAQSKKESRLI